MKLGNIIKTSILGAALVAAVGCHDAEYCAIENIVYISEASSPGVSNQQIESVVVEGTTQIAIHVRIAQPVDYDINVRLGYAPEFVEEYNESYNASYEILPEEYLTFDGTAVIKAGSTSSDNVNINIKEFSTDNGEAYCVPLKIVESDAPFGVTEKSSRIIYLLEAPHRQVVPTFTWQQAPGPVNDKWGISTAEWTLEAWVWMSGYPINNQAIFNASVSQGTEIYIRFGDAPIPYNQLQIKTGGSQLETNHLFATNTWYHLAFTFANNQLTIYINGEIDSQKDISVANYVIEGLELCSSGSSYFRANCKMAQVRFWSKALSQAAILSAMNRQVPADSEGLFCYLKLDEGEGMFFHDATGKGHDLESKGSNMAPSAPAWSTEMVNFSNPNNQ